MSKFKKKSDKNNYDFSDSNCIGRMCFVPGMFNHYSKSISGANSNTHQTPECINRAYHGCNKYDNPFRDNLALERKKEGWRQSY
jgi:hypothetical protein